MRKLALAAVSVALTVAAGAALAQTSTAPAAHPGLTGISVGNTMEVDYPNVPGHPHVTFKMKPDGTFTAVFPGNIAGSGDYVADARYVCWITKVPAETSADGANARCEANTAAGKAVGDTWTMTDSMGAEAVITIKPGQ
jgi:membrane-bound inhibitor of C-type lysozyme